jgi:hypothetical protein
MRSILLSLLFFSFCITVMAEDCTGYIIKNGTDTVKGVLDIPIYKGAVNTKREIMFADMWQTVKFAEGTAKKKKMDAGEVSGFGFEYFGEWYHYEVLDLQKNYGQKAPKLLAKMLNDLRFFILRVDNGFLPIYREYWNSETERKSENPVSGRTTTIIGKQVNIEIWVKSKDGTFIEMAPTTLGGQKKLKNFLREYLKLEDEFLQTVEDKAKFEDAEDVLVRYNAWKKNKS